MWIWFIQALENRTKESKQEMDILEKLEELRDLNARHANGELLSSWLSVYTTFIMVNSNFCIVAESMDEMIILTQTALSELAKYELKVIKGCRVIAI